MKKLLFINLVLLFVNSAFTQTTYTFAGNGSWRIASNWQGNNIPPQVLPSGSTIRINPSGICILDTTQTITAGASFIVDAGKTCTITGSLYMAPVVPLYKLRGMGFSPYYEGETPDDTSIHISESRISYLLQRIALYTDTVRSYGATNGLEKIGKHAHNQGMKVAAGAWLGTDSISNEVSITNLIAMGQAGEINVAIVGNETSLTGVPKTKLISYIRRVKNALPGIPVTTADLYYYFDSTLISEIDQLYVHIYPYWEGQNIDCATYFVDQVYSALQAKSSGKKIVIAETGWPSDGSQKGLAIPSPANAARFFLHFTSWAKAKNVQYFYFEAFDEPWKVAHEGSPGAHWGLWEKNAGALKPGMDAVFRDSTVADNWILDSAAIRSQDTTLSFTFVPPICSTANFEGRATGVFPTDCRIAAFIFNQNGWWNKPTSNDPLTPLSCDGTFSFSILAYLQDRYAPRIKIFLVRSDYVVPILSGPPTLPPELEQNAYAWVDTIRLAAIPILTSSAINSIGMTTAICESIIQCQGSDMVNVKGVCWNTSGAPQISDSHTSDGPGTNIVSDPYTSNITGLLPNTTYYVRAYATNDAGTAYGNEIVFQTAYSLPVVVTTGISNFPGTTAFGGGDIMDDGGAEVYSRGVCWATSTNPTIADTKAVDIYGGSGAYAVTVSGLLPNTTYFLRAFATSAAGTGYGNQISFTTTQSSPFSVGQTHQGGKIFYIDGTGQHGLIAALSDTTAMQWYNGSYVITNALSESDGSANTNTIVNLQGNGTYAARACQLYPAGQIDGWFLPAKNQLNILWGARGAIGGFVDYAFYWSSTEINGNFASCHYFPVGYASLAFKADANRVRPIKAF